MGDKNHAPSTLAYYNTTNYPLSVKSHLETVDLNQPTTPEQQKLLLHQLLSFDFFVKNKKVRGLLIDLGMGMGKTRLTTAIVEHIRQHEKNRKIIIVLSKSLESNFKKEVHRFTQYDSNTNSDNLLNKADPLNDYTFISLNANNMFKQVSNIDKTEEEINYEENLGDLLADLKRKNSLNNSLIVVDEAHNLFNSIVNGSKNALSFYDSIMEANNIRLIFLTGTPIINSPFELVPCYNMLRGKLYGMGGSSNMLFPEDREEFENYFIDEDNLVIKNRDKFINRIYGLTSYYGDLYFKDANDKPGFPKKLPPIIVKVPMSSTQFVRYQYARSIEQEEGKKVFKGQKVRFSSSKGGTSTYRVRSRQISNYCIPDYALHTKMENGRKTTEKRIDQIRVEDLADVKKYSPKMNEIIQNCSKYTAPGMIYSQFVSGEGLAIFAKVLEVVAGFTNFSAKIADNGFDIDNANVSSSSGKKYAILSGNITIEERSNIISEFNKKENANGSVIKLLLISGAVAEGIDLKRIRHLHIMEPFWNYARLNQVITRAIRLGSHTDLPENEQNVQVYIYLSDYPIEYDKSKIKEKTTDIELYEKSIKNMQLIDSFSIAIAESSIDCSIHHKNLDPEVKNKIKCRICAPTNEMLFHPIIYKDMMMPNNCHSYEEKEVKVKEIIDTTTGEKYYYDVSKNNLVNKINVYYMDKKINGYVKMTQSNPYYARIMNLIYEKINPSQSTD